MSYSVLGTGNLLLIIDMLLKRQFLMSMKKALLVLTSSVAFVVFCTVYIKARTHFGVGFGFHSPHSYWGPYWGPAYYDPWGPRAGVVVHTNDPGAAIALGTMGAVAGIAAASSVERKLNPDVDLNRHDERMKSEKVSRIKSIDRKINKLHSQLQRKKSSLSKSEARLSNRKLSEAKRNSLSEEVIDLKADIEHLDSEIKSLKDEKNSLREEYNDI